MLRRPNSKGFWTLILATVFVLFGQAKSQVEQPPSVLDKPVSFSGPDKQTRISNFHEIRIGFFAPSDQQHPVGGQMLNAAQLAIDEANAAGGLQGVPFRLTKRWSDGPWGAASKEMIKLVYKDSVWAVIGSLQGGTTHIAEQVVTKAWVPLLAPVSADPTLTYIRIPWMFRLPPDEQKQAQVIVEEGILPQLIKKIGLITSTDHDGRIFAQEILRSLNASQLQPVFHLQLPPSSKNSLQNITATVRSFHPEALIIRLPRDEIFGLIEYFENDKLNLPLFFPWVPGMDFMKLKETYSGKISCVQPFEIKDNPNFKEFVNRYQRRYKSEPSFSAAYTYDAVMIVIRALQRSGLNKAKLRDKIFLNSGFKGVTGDISWDNTGGNMTQPVLNYK